MTETKMTFGDLGLPENLLSAVLDLGFETPSPIQQACIPHLLNGRDVLGMAQTGSGKTAAFSLPLLAKIDAEERYPQMLVMAPTRELAIQVADACEQFTKHVKGVRIVTLYGGQRYDIQLRALKQGAQVVVGTPGRILDHIRRGTLDLSNLQSIVLDEADEMLRMGFIEDVETVMAELPEQHQTALFSATMPEPIRRITKRFMQDPQEVKIQSTQRTNPDITQICWFVRGYRKNEALLRFLEVEDFDAAILFTRTKTGTLDVTELLEKHGFRAAALNGDMTQQLREQTLDRLRNGSLDILVATDVAARGIDVDEVEAVFNYDLPQDDEYYVHRIGRTGRAGREGRAFSFVSGKEVYKLKEIQRYCKTKIYAQKVPSLNDVANTKMENILDDVERVIEQEDLDMMINAIEERVNNSEFTAMDMAAAFLKICCGMTEDNKNTEENDWEFGDTGAGEDGMVRLFINIGKKQRVRPGDILGAIAGESGMDGKLIGTIDMYDKYTFVEVPREYAREVLNAMKNVKIKGKTVAVEPANQK